MKVYHKDPPIHMSENLRKIVFNYVGRVLLFDYHKIHTESEITENKVQINNPNLEKDIIKEEILEEIDLQHEDNGVSSVNQVDNAVNIDHQVANNMNRSSPIKAKTVYGLMDILYDIRREVSKLSKKLNDDNLEGSLREEWKQAANVLDRLFLLMCFICTVSTVLGLTFY